MKGAVRPKKEILKYGMPILRSWVQVPSEGSGNGEMFTLVLGLSVVAGSLLHVLRAGMCNRVIHLGGVNFVHRQTTSGQEFRGALVAGDDGF